MPLKGSLKTPGADILLGTPLGRLLMGAQLTSARHCPRGPLVSAREAHMDVGF